MKKRLLIPLLLFTIAVNGQTFDFYNKKLIGESCKIENKNFTFTVININTIKYDVLIDDNPVNYNQDIPDLIKEYLTKVRGSIARSGVNDSSTASIYNMSQCKSIEELKSLYSTLKKSEHFHNLLIELISSDLQYISMIDYKRSYFKKYIGKDSEDDESDISSIVDFYSKYINDIPLCAISLKEKLNNHSDNVIVDTILKETKRIDSLNIPMKIASLYYKINEQSFSVYSFKPKPDADDLTINITAKPNTGFNMRKDEIKVEIPLIVNGGFKLDYSEGFFFSNVTDKEYITKPTYINDSITGYNLIKSEDNPLCFGFAGYMHAYWRSASNINVSLSFGVGIDQNTQLKIMPGISILMGRKERFIINGGLVMGKIKDLSKVQDLKHLYNENIEPIYSDSYKAGYFVGISYNLLK